MAIIAAHMGIVDEDAIDNMSMVFFEDVLSELGKKLNYDAVVNYAGNSFCEKSWDMIHDANPFTDKKSETDSAFGAFVNGLIGT